MPDVTNQEFVVTAHVNQRFWGQSYSTYTYEGATYWTFSSAPYERWVDLDGDGWWDYGLRDEGQGHWSRFEGFNWDNGTTPPPGDRDGTPAIEIPPEGMGAQQTLTLHPDVDMWTL